MSRKAPSDSATKFKVGKKMRGNDGNIWIIIKASNGVQRWKLHNNSDTKKTQRVRRSRMQRGTRRRRMRSRSRYQEPNSENDVSEKTEKRAPIKGKKYFTHNNGGRPFMVVFNGNNVDIYTYSSNFNHERDLVPKDYYVHIKSYKNIHKKFIGTRIKGDDATKLSPSFALGNSILLKITNKRYVFIGSFIYEFEPEDEIKEYYSMIGNSDVPYPVAIGEKNVYFLIERCYLSKEHFKDFPSKYSWGLDAYSKLYGSLKFVPEEELKGKISKKNTHSKKKDGRKKRYRQFSSKEYMNREKLRKKVSLIDKSKKIPKIKIVTGRE
tara:strand:- start:874 stop:1842 length:969 start_codon:yes stop_codon:yes gene_type:complete